MKSDCRSRHVILPKGGILGKGILWCLVSFLAAGMATAVALGCVATEEPTQLPPTTPAPVPANLQTAETGPESGSPASPAGKQLFNANCSQCHGVEATGTDAGPPLVHQLYVSNHHPDFSFQAAVKQGVTAHHWFFGDMPPVPGLSEADVANIICYVRTLQRDEGFPVNATC